MKKFEELVRQHCPGFASRVVHTQEGEVRKLTPLERSDSGEDFQEVSVWGLKNLVEAAYQAGLESSQESNTKPTTREILWEDVYDIWPAAEMAREANSIVFPEALKMAAIQLFKDAEANSERACRIRWALSEMEQGRYP